MSCRVVIVDCGMGNLNSVRKKLSNLDCEPRISSGPDDLKDADKIILPGVGHFQSAMETLSRMNLQNALNEAVLVRRKPILGICLGMQLMASRSEEGDAIGLGWIEGEVVRFRTRDPLKFKVPHIGWNQVSLLKESQLVKGIPASSEFYFVHSYYLQAADPQDVLSATEYEETFTSAIERQNIFGVQFHPEKSHDVGEKLLSNFVNM